MPDDPASIFDKKYARGGATVAENPAAAFDAKYAAPSDGGLELGSNREDVTVPDTGVMAGPVAQGKTDPVMLSEYPAYTDLADADALTGQRNAGNPEFQRAFRTDGKMDPAKTSAYLAEIRKAHAESIPAAQAVAAHFGRAVASGTTLGFWKGGLSEEDSALLDQNRAVQGPAGQIAGTAGMLLAAANPLGPVAGLTRGAQALKIPTAGAVGFGTAQGIEQRSPAAALEGYGFAAGAGGIGGKIAGEGASRLRAALGEAAGVGATATTFEALHGHGVDWLNVATQMGGFGLLKALSVSPISPEGKRKVIQEIAATEAKPDTPVEVVAAIGHARLTEAEYAKAAEREAATRPDSESVNGEPIDITMERGQRREEARLSAQAAPEARPADPRKMADDLNAAVGGKVEDLLSGPATLTRGEQDAVRGAWSLLSRAIGEQGTARDVYERSPEGSTRSDMADALRTIEHVYDVRVRRGQMPESEADTSLPGAGRPALPEAPAAPREEVIQPKAEEPSAKTAETAETPPSNRENSPVVSADTPPPVEPPSPPAPKATESATGPGGEPTSLKNRIVNAEREARGLEPVADTEPQTREGWRERGQKIVAENPSRPHELVDEILRKPRNLTPEENAVLLVHRVNTNRALESADAAGVEAAKRGDADAVATAQANAERALADRMRLDEAGKAAGAEWGRGGVARQMEMAADYSLARIQADIQRENGYKPLTEADRAEARDLFAKVEAARKELADYESRKAEIDAQRALGRVRTSESRRAPRESAEYGKANKVVTREAYEATKAALREKLNRMNVGIDPTILADLAKMGVFHVEAGVRGFARWAEAMTEGLSDKERAKVEPHLQAAWLATHKELSGKVIEDVSGKIRTGIEAGKSLDKMAGDVGRIAETFIAQGVENRGELIGKVHDVLKTIDPEITRRETAVALSGYGNITALNNDPIKVKLRELKGQVQQELKLEDMSGGKPPLKSGPERQAPGDVQRELIRLVNEAKKRGGYDVRDPETQLKSALDGAKTRMRNGIADMARQIAALKKDVPNRTRLELDAEAATLKTEYDAMRAKYNEVFGKPGMTDAQRVEAAIKATEKSIAELERRAEAGDVFPAERTSKTPETPELKALREKREALRERIKDIRDAAMPRGKTADQMDAARAEAAENAVLADIRAVEKSIAEYQRKIQTGDVFPAKPEADGPVDPRLAAARATRDALREQANDIREAARPRRSPSEIAEQMRKTRLKNQIAFLENAAATGQLDRPAKRTPPVADAETIKLQARMEMAKQAVNEAIFRRRLANENIKQKAVRYAMEGNNLSRAFMTSPDFSAVLRQGIFRVLGHPIEAVRAMGPMFKAFGNPIAGGHAMAAAEKAGVNPFKAVWDGINAAGEAGRRARAEAEAEIKARLNYRLMRQAGVHFSEHGDVTLDKMEEAYQSRLAEHIPFVAGSGRAFTTFINRIRADAFDSMAASFSNGPSLTPAEAKAIGAIVNTVTGRGGAQDSKLLNGLSAGIWSPRLLASRLQLLYGHHLFTGTARTKVAMAKEYARFLIGAAVVYSLAKLAGGEIEIDPTNGNPDFGKVKIGNTRLDPMGGLLQVTRLVATEGHSALSAAGIVKKNRQDERSAETLGKFLRSKLTPLVGAGVNLITGKDFKGDTADIGTEAVNLVTPMALMDIKKAMEEQGVPTGAALGILSMFGMGLQTYEKKRPKGRR